MNGGPFRVPKSTEGRSVPARQESVHRSPQTRPSQPIEEKATPVQRMTSARTVHEEEKSPMRFVVPIISGVIVLIVAAVVAWFAWSHTKAATIPGIEQDKYQAVFLTNGQVYFGKLVSSSKEYVTLDDVYYLQGQQQAQSASNATNEGEDSSESSTTQLIKLGDEIHGPEDGMIVSRDQVLFVENLKNDSKVVKTIKDNSDE